jgi:hypothetical protein
MENNIGYAVITTKEYKEMTEDYQKSERIDEQEDGNQTSSTIL